MRVPITTELDAEIYKDVPVELRETLRQFRESHPYRRLQVGKTRWEYIASGQGPETILLLGGAMSVGETGFQTIRRLEKVFRVLSPSYPAAGKMSAVVEGLAAILDAEGVERAHVSGHSLGAAVAHIFVRQCSERVGKLLMDGFGLYTPRHVRAAKLFFMLPYPLLVAYYRRRMKQLLSGGSDPEMLLWKAYMEELLTRLHTRETLMAQFKVMMDVFDQAENYGVFRPVEKPGEVLLVLAKDDRGFTPEEREALIATYPGAQVHWFESGGHLSGFTRRAEFSQMVDEFLKGQD